MLHSESGRITHAHRWPWDRWCPRSEKRVAVLLSPADISERRYAHYMWGLVTCSDHGARSCEIDTLQSIEQVQVQMCRWALESI